MSVPLASIVIVEDDLRLSELVRRYLENNGFRVTCTASGYTAVEEVRRRNPDLIILDIGLPGQDGFEVCKQLRPFYSNPILILTARNNDIDQVLGLELGADDYVVKPVEPRVLMARVQALLRRSRTPIASAATLQFGRLVINTIARSVSIDGHPIALSSNEFDLLVCLASRAGQIQSRASLYIELYGREYDGLDRMLDVRISNLRKKLGDDALHSERIKTIRGKGYLFVPNAW